MRRRSFLLILCLIWAGQVSAQMPCCKDARCRGWWAGFKGCPSLGCCPDDYCRKPFPDIHPIPCCGGPDDYCRKPAPCLTDVPRCGDCDDYCRKPFPCLLCPPFSPYLQCGPPEPCCPYPQRR